MRFCCNLVVLLIALPAWASDLVISEEELFQRCYSQLTRMSLHPQNSLLAAVKSGSLRGAAACTQVLQSAKFQSQSNMTPSAATDQNALAVLKTFHNLHSTWMSTKFMESNDNCRERAEADIWDITQPATYYTRSLFTPGVQAKSVVTDSQSYRPKRTVPNPTVGPGSGRNLIPYIATTWSSGPTPTPIETAWNVNYAPSGDILGIEPVPSLVMPGSLYDPFKNAMDLNLHSGGGILGDAFYRTKTIREFSGLNSDGALKMPRRWSRAIYRDLLCRELPVVRYGDATPFVSSQASATFRQNISCTQCHVSMDRLGGVVRNSNNITGADCSGNDKRSIMFTGLMTTTLPDRQISLQGDSNVWPLKTDSSYARRPLRGTLYYRSYNGSLINREVNGVQDLGNQLATLDDLYVCTAKRYFQYFTGIDADIRDIADPMNTIQLSDKQREYRDFVIRLGENLKSHQELMRTIEDIIKSDYYRLNNYGLGENP